MHLFRLKNSQTRVFAVYIYKSCSFEKGSLLGHDALVEVIEIGATPKMLSGYNHNVTYAGEVYHVQTEDFGREKSYFLTQIFLGGTLVAKAQCAYKKDPTDPNTPSLTDPLRARMRQFHAQMIDNLKAGKYVAGPKVVRPDYRAMPVSDEDVDAFVLKNFTRLPI